MRLVRIHKIGLSPGAATTSTAPAFYPPWVRIVPALAVVVAIWWAQAVLIPFVLSVLISYALEPLVKFLESHRIPRAAAVPVLLMTLLTVGGTGAYLLRGEAGAFIDQLPVAAHTAAQAIEGAAQARPGAMAKVQAAARELESAASRARKNPQDGITAVRIEEPTFRWSDWFWQGSRGAVEFAAQMFAVLCLVFYLLAAGDLYKRKLVRIMPTLSDKKATVEILAEIDRQIERFLLSRLVVNAVVGVVVWAAFEMIGLAQPGVWGVLSAIIFTIPTVGPVLFIVGATIAASVQFGSLGMAAAAGGISTFIAAVEGNVLAPWLMSRAGQMNAGAVFISLLFWGWIWGGWGLLLAVPITGAVKAVCDRVPQFSALGELLGE